MSEYSRAYTEVLTILDHMSSKYKGRLPKSLIDFFNNNKDDSYECDIDFSVPLKENNLDPNTITIFAMLLINFWCDTPEEKQSLINLYFENEQNYQKSLNEKYNPDGIFEKKDDPLKSFTNIDSDIIVDSGTLGTENESTDISEYSKLKWYQKIIYKIKNLFKKNHG